MKKLLSLLTMLIVAITSSYADETYYLQEPGAEKPTLTGHFYTTATLSQDQACSYNDVNYTKVVKFSGNGASWGNNEYTDRAIRYDCKTDDTQLTVVAYCKNTSSTFVLGHATEAPLGNTGTVSDLTSYKATTANTVVASETYSIQSSNPSSFYVSVNGNSNVFIVQIIAVEKGNALVKPGTAGYTMNFNKGRVGARSGAVVTFDATPTTDGVEICQNANYEPGSTSSAKMQTNGTNYIKFSVATPMVLNFTTSSTTKYNVSTTKGSTDNQITPTANTPKAIKLTSAGTYYINPQGSNVTPTGMSFSAAPVVSYNANGGEGTMEDTYFTVAENGFTAPAGQIFDGWKDSEDYVYNVGDDVEANVTLYAQWRTPTATYSVEYDLNGGTGTTPTETDKEANVEFTLAGIDGITAPTGTKFAGWKDQDNDVYVAGATYTMKGYDVTLTAQWENIYAITPLVGIEHGSVSADKATAAEGETVTLTATPDFKYVLDSWNVYKTGDPETTVTVTDNKFTMPAYAVTIGATFVSDTRKQILYVKANGTIDNTDKLYTELIKDYGVTVAAYNASKTVTDFDLVVLHESIGGGNYGTGLVAAAKSANVPLLNTKAYFYSDGRWSWGAPNAGNKELGCTIGTDYVNIASHPIFAGITPDENGFIEVVTALSTSDKDKAMQPIGSFVSGKEGYTLATAQNAPSVSGNGAAIHELTPAQRGVESAKYLMISLHNECFSKLTADGITLFKNAVEYLMGNEAWVPVASQDINVGTSGFATVGLPFATTVPEGVTAYAVSAVAGSKVTMSSAIAAGTTVPANKGFVIVAAPGDYTFTEVAEAEYEGDNLLEAVGATPKAATTDAPIYVLAVTGEKKVGFKKATTGSLGAYKAYLPGALVPSGGNSLEISFDGETAINGIAESEANAEAPVKVVKNGQLYIGDFNVAGQQVK